jgi:hypothetical protein
VRRKNSDEGEEEERWRRVRRKNGGAGEEK